MSLAPPYSPTASFANDETNQVSGRSTVRTVAVDTELANISTTVNALKSNLEKLQRDDDKLRDFLVEPYALAEQTRALIAAGGRPRGLWAAGQVYAVGDVVQQSGFAYQCYTAHTATAPFTANGFWISISGDGSAATNAAAAAASEVAATAAAAAAAASVTSAGASATAAAGSATTAGTSATAAGNSATAAAASAAAAANSVVQAAAGASAADASAFAADASADAAAASAAAAAGAVGNASSISLTNDSTTNAPHYLTFADGTAGQENLKTDTAKLSYNPSTGALAASSFAGNLSAANLTSGSVPDARLPQVIGIGQTWQSVARTSGVTYTNSTGRPIQVNAWDTNGPNLTGYQTLQIVVAGVLAAYSRQYLDTESSSCFVSAIVPPGAPYVISIAGSFNAMTVAELR